MIIDRIRVGKSVEALGLWHKLDLEASIDEHESPEWAHGVLKDLLDKLLPSVSNSPYNTINAYAPQVIDRKKEDIEILIDNCTSKEELKKLQNDAFKYKLETEYLKKMSSFQ